MRGDGQEMQHTWDRRGFGVAGGCCLNDASTLLIYRVGKSDCLEVSNTLQTPDSISATKKVDAVFYSESSEKTFNPTRHNKPTDFNLRRNILI